IDSNRNFFFSSPMYVNRFSVESVSAENLKKTRDLASAKPELINEMGILVKLVLDVMSEPQHFGSDLQEQKSLELQEIAFIHFGQGTLYDDTIDPKTHQKRRPKEFMIHMMDGSTDLYFFWH